MKKSINPRAISIQSRFFQALELLIENGKIPGGLKEFCIKNNLNRPKYSTLRALDGNTTDASLYKVIDIDALAALADYGVSPDWLLSGRGGMFTNIL